MAVSNTLSASLNSMSVPGADGKTDGGLLMPKLQYRFRVTFLNFGVDKAGGTELTKQVIDFTRPNVSFPEIPIEVYNSRIYLAGKPTWEAVSINVRDDINGSIAKMVGEQIQKQFDFSEQASAAAGGDYKFQVNCEILDGGMGTNGVQVLERWELYGCYLASANYNSLNYATNEAVTIALSIRFDNALQTAGSGGVGNSIGRAIGTAVSGIGQ
jgi:hypothetical protein